MGNVSSDWTGVRWFNDGFGPYTDIYDLQPSSLTNDNISAPTGNESNNSSFYGQYDAANNEVTIVREILRTEQDTDDESILRIENGRTLEGNYWDNTATKKSFEIEIQGATSVVLATATLIGASLLAF